MISSSTSIHVRTYFCLSINFSIRINASLRRHLLFKWRLLSERRRLGLSAVSVSLTIMKLSWMTSGSCLGAPCMGLDRALRVYLRGT